MIASNATDPVLSHVWKINQQKAISLTECTYSCTWLAVIDLGDFDGEIRPDNLIRLTQRLNNELNLQLPRIDQPVYLQVTV